MPIFVWFFVSFFVSVKAASNKKMQINGHIYKKHMSQVCKIKVMIQNNTSILWYSSGDFAPSLIFIFLYGCQCYKMNIYVVWRKIRIRMNYDWIIMFTEFDRQTGILCLAACWANTSELNLVDCGYNWAQQVDTCKDLWWWFVLFPSNSQG